MNLHEIAMDASQTFSPSGIPRNILVWIAPECADIIRLKASAEIVVVDNDGVPPEFAHYLNSGTLKKTLTSVLPSDVTAAPSSASLESSSSAARQPHSNNPHHDNSSPTDRIVVPGVISSPVNSASTNQEPTVDQIIITNSNNIVLSSSVVNLSPHSPDQTLLPVPLQFLKNAMEDFLRNASASVATNDEVLRQVYCVVTDHPAAIEHFGEHMQTYIDFNIHWFICETFENRDSLRNLPNNRNRASILQTTDISHKVVGDEKVNRYNPSASRAAHLLGKELNGHVPTPNALDDIDKLLLGPNIVQYPPSVGKLFENITLLHKATDSLLFTGYTKKRKEKRVIRQFLNVSEEFMQVFTRLHQLSRSTSACHNVSAPMDVNEKERFFTVEPHLCSFEKAHHLGAAPYAFVLRAFHTIICAFKSVHSLNCLFRWFGPQSIAFDLHQQMRVGISFCATVELRNENTSVLLTDYASPEALLDEEFSFAGDMWCVGATLFRMLTSVKIFENVDPKELRKYVSDLRSKANEKPHVDVRDRINLRTNGTVPSEFITLIESLLSFDPKKRPTIEQIEKLPFFPNTKEKIMALPQLDVDTAKEEYAKVERKSPEFERIVKQIQAAQYKCADRAFIVSVESIETISNPVLRRMHEETRRKLAMAEHGGEMHNAVSLGSVDKKHLADDKFAFYGVKAFKGQEGGKDSLSAKEVRGSIAQRGLLRVGHPKNPNQNQRGTTGGIGPNTEGVYLARFPVDAVRYSVPDDRPLEHNDTAEIIVFEVALGRCHKEWKSGMRFDDYKNKYDSFMDAKDVYLRDDDDKIHSTLAFPSFVVKIRVVRDEWYDPNEKTSYVISMKHEDILGKGGFGIVRRGMMLSGGKPVPIACKIFGDKKKVRSTSHNNNNNNNHNDEERKRFIQFCKHEFEIMQNFRDYQSVAKVIDFKECRDGQVVLFMELLAMSLEEMIQKFGVLKPLTAARYFRQAASGLHALELEKYVHGDIKLHNLMLSHSGEVKLTDFGLADEVGCNLTGLSWFYAAPEVFFECLSAAEQDEFLEIVNGSHLPSQSTPDGSLAGSPLNNTNNSSSNKQKTIASANSGNRSRNASPSSGSPQPTPRESNVGRFPDQTGRDETALDKNVSAPQVHRDPDINNNNNFAHQQQQRSSSDQAVAFARVPTNPGLHHQRHSYRPKKIYAPFTAESFSPSTVTHAADCYSLGVCLWKMLVKDEIPENVMNPLTGDDPTARRIPDMAYIRRREDFIKSGIPAHVAKKYPSIVQMIYRCVDFNPRNRPTFDEIRTQFNPLRDLYSLKHNNNTCDSLLISASLLRNPMTNSDTLLRASLSVSSHPEIPQNMSEQDLFKALHPHEAAVKNNKNRNNGNDDDDDDNDQLFHQNHRRSNDGGMMLFAGAAAGRIATDNGDVSSTGLNQIEAENQNLTTSDDEEVKFYDDHSGRASTSRANSSLKPNFANNNNNNNHNQAAAAVPPQFASQSVAVRNDGFISNNNHNNNGNGTSSAASSSPPPPPSNAAARGGGGATEQPPARLPPSQNRNTQDDGTESSRFGINRGATDYVPYISGRASEASGNSNTNSENVGEQLQQQHQSAVSSSSIATGVQSLLQQFDLTRNGEEIIRLIREEMARQRAAQSSLLQQSSPQQQQQQQQALNQARVTSGTSSNLNSVATGTSHDFDFNSE